MITGFEFQRVSQRLILPLMLALCMAQAGRAEDRPGWKRSLAFGLNLNQGNTDTLLGDVNFTARRQTERFDQFFEVKGTYGEADDATTVQRARAHANMKRMFGDSYVYLNSEIQHDDIADIDQRVVSGVGVGRFLVRSDRQALSGDIGIGHLAEKSAGQSDAYPVLRLSERYDGRVSHTATVWESLEYLPNLEDAGQFLLNAEAGIETTITERLHLRLVLQNKYNSAPAAGRDKNDLALISALSVKL